jgi:peptide/nickel transport system substrate-binding protein
MRFSTRAALTLSLAAVLGGPAVAAPFKWASQDDAVTMDPHAFNHGMTLTVLSHIYEGLVRRDRNSRIEPALAASWEQVEPTRWRFKLREGVKFHEGQPLTPDDVVFSIQRAMAPESDMKVFAASIVEVKPSGPMQVDIVTEFPNGALLQSLPELRIMSRAWAQANGALAPAEMRKKSENAATRRANGTGPFRLELREPDIRTVLKAHAGWWDRPQGNVTEATLVRIASDPTRMAALLSGEVDFAYPIPLQDINRLKQAGSHKVLQGPEVRTMFLTLDMSSDELKYSDVKGANPFKDRRVRQALYQAIDVEAIKSRIMADSVVATGSMVPGGVNGAEPSQSQRPYPYDVAAARKLMADAGYAKGFQVTLDCTNDRYVNDEQVCSAIAAMLARIDVKVTLNPLPAARFFPKVGARDSSFNFFGYAPVNLDAFNTLNVTMATRDAKSGQWNVGGYSSQATDNAIRRVLTELDPAKRTAAVTQAITQHKNDIGHIPLYQQGLSWGMKRNVEAALQPDNRVNLNFITLNGG